MIKQVFTVLFLASGLLLYSQENSILFDGHTSDWQEQHYLSYDDPDNDGESIELESLKITNDGAHLYIQFTLKEDLLLNSNNDLTLYLDTDQNLETGYEAGNIGAELQWRFGDRKGDFIHSKEQVYHNDLKFSALPTVTSDTFEIKIGLDVKPDGINPLFNGNTFNLLIASEDGGDAIPNAAEKLTYHINEDLYNAYEPVGISISEQADLRVMSYNVLHDGIMKPERQPYFERVMQATAPDVIVFNECWDTRAVDIRNFLNDILPLGEGKQWQAVKKDGGNIIASRYFITDSWHVKDNMRITAALIDLPDEELPRDFLMIGAHFRCCDANEARQREADAFIQFVLDAKTTGGRIDLQEGTPIMLAGDLNLVGDAQQLETLLTGDILNEEAFGQGGAPDWDGSGLQDVISYHTDKPYAFTWVNNGSSYWPGRLDFGILSNSVSQVVKKFILETTNMPEERLQQYGLQPNDTREASDHLPKITDIKINRDVSAQLADRSAVTIFPNPASKMIQISTGDVHVDSIRAFSAATGHQMMSLESANDGKSAYNINIQDWDKGIYIFQVSVKDSIGAVYKKILVL